MVKRKSKSAILFLTVILEDLFGLLFIGVFCMSWYQNAKYKQPPFSYEIAAIKEDFVWTFNKKSIIKPLYEDHVKDHNDPEFIKNVSK